MKLLTFLLFLLISPARAQSSSDLKQVELDFAKMLVQEDWDHYAGRLTEDYLRINQNGTEQNKQETMAYLRSGAARSLDLSPENLTVRVHGDVAIVNGRHTAVQRLNGKVITTYTNFTDVFAKQDGNWLLTTSQFTTAPK
jgi:ketosteroid isomerase-like protein